MSKTNSIRDMLGREELTAVHTARTVLLSYLENIEPETEKIPSTILSDSKVEIDSLKRNTNY